MTTTTRRPLEEYLAVAYPFNVLADPAGGYVIVFPDLPGCMTQVEDLADVGPMAEEIRTLWLETEYERGQAIPPPTYPEEYSGKFNLRLPRSLHRALAEAAERENVSLNQYAVAVLARGDAQARIEARLLLVEQQLEAIQKHLGCRVISGQLHGPAASTDDRFAAALHPLHKAREERRGLRGPTASIDAT
jgi:predicted RNase H-like HicB family nuclease